MAIVIVQVEVHAPTVEIAKQLVSASLSYSTMLNAKVLKAKDTSKKRSRWI